MKIFYIIMNIFNSISVQKNVSVDLLWQKALDRSQTASFHLQCETNTEVQLQFEPTAVPEKILHVHNVTERDTK